MASLLDRAETAIGRYLSRENRVYKPFTPSNPEYLKEAIRPGDVLLVEGSSRLSGMIKYLTQSTWSHAALYVGPIDGRCEADGEPHVLVEANIGAGVVSTALSGYYTYHTRLCRPIALSDPDRDLLCRYAIDRIGLAYDTRNLLDLARYLLPFPVPQRWRRRMIALGSGDPTRTICSTLIAQAFNSVRYPILPRILTVRSAHARHEILHIRDSSLYMPRDFDISPFFEIVKPTLAHGFDYTTLDWDDDDVPRHPVPELSPPAPSQA